MILFSALAKSALADPSFECGMTNASQVETANCLATVEDTVDAALNAALTIAERAAQELDAITERDLAAPALHDSQTAWTAYRDAQCGFVGSTFGGGSGTGIAIRSCRIEMGRARISELLANAR